MSRIILLITAFFIGTYMVNIDAGFAKEDQLITHNKNEKAPILSHEERLKSSTTLTLPLEEELALLAQMKEFELGRYLLNNRGINGYWTAYWLIHGPQKKLDHPLEDWLINRAPYFVGSQERFKIFAAQTQKRIKDNVKIASIPSGLMDDLLRLDYSGKQNVSIVGIDLDENSLKLAKENAKQLGKEKIATFEKASAWNLNKPNEFDIITSNGLNFYEKDDEKVVQLYREFYKSLKPKGILITSFLTPAPALSKESSWKNVNPEDALKQKAIFIDIMDARWIAVRTEKQTRQQLEEAGFHIIDVIYDAHGVFPTIIAEK